MIRKPHRKTSLVAGALYLLTFISIPTLSLYGPIRGNVGHMLESGAETGVVLGVILEIIMALACIGTAVVLYPLLRKQSEALALGLVASRVLEAAAIFIGTTLVMSAVSLSHSSADAGTIASGHMLVTLYDRLFLQSQSFLPAVNDLLLGILLYKSRLVPRTISLIGIFGAFPLLAGYVAIMFNLIGQHDPLAGLAAVFVALFEFILGIWLVFRGFDRKAVAALEK